MHVFIPLPLLLARKQPNHAVMERMQSIDREIWVKKVCFVTRGTNNVLGWSKNSTVIFISMSMRLSKIH